MWRPAALLVLTALLLSAQGAVEGTVVNSITREPVPGATIDLTAPNQPALHTITGTSGAFRFSDLPPGDYTPAFDADHYFASKSDPFRITTAGESLRIEGELDPITTLNGRVFDPDGKPIGGMRVELQSHRAGISFLTDAEGRYHVTDLQPDTYLLLARPNRGLKVPGQVKQPPPTRDKTVRSPTYYPSVTEAAQAVPVRAAGGELHGYDIHLRSVPVYRIRGVLHDEPGNPVPKVTLTLRQAPMRDSLGNPEAETVTGDGGKFEFADIGPGNWLILAESKKDGVDLAGFTVVSVSRHDEENVHLQLAAPFTLEGEVQPEAHVKHLYLNPLDGPGRLEAYAEVNSDGHFQFKYVYPGRYQPIRPSAAGAYLTEVRLGEQDVTGQPLTLAPGSPPLRLVYKFDVGSVHGTVENGARATVVLFPGTPGDYPAMARCTPDGKFEINGLRPGDYSAMAFTRIDEDLTAVPPAMQRGVTIHVEPSRSASVDLPLSAGVH